MTTKTAKGERNREELRGVRYWQPAKDVIRFVLGVRVYIQGVRATHR